MTTIIPTPAPVPDPLSSDFGTKAYDFTVWMADAAPAMTALGNEINIALNQSLLGVTSDSTTSLPVTVTTKTLTVGTGLGYAPGMPLKLTSKANVSNYIKGIATAYNKITGQLDLLGKSVGGSGTFADWTVTFDVPDASSGYVPIGGLIANKNRGTSFTENGTTYLKTGVISPTATYPLAPTTTINDGATWLTKTGVSLASPRLASNGSGTVIAVPRNTNGTGYAISTDYGATWAAATFPASISGIPVWCGTFFLIINLNAGAATTTFYTSATGATGSWTARTVPSNTFSNGVYGTQGCIITTTTTQGYITTDGITYTPITMPIAAMSGTFGNGFYVFANPTASFSVYKTSNGASFATKTVPVETRYNAVNPPFAFGEGVFLYAQDAINAKCFTTSDFETFTVSDTGIAIGNNFARVFGNGTFLLLQSGTAAYSSDDLGVTWTARTMVANTDWSCVVNTGTSFVGLASGTTTATQSVSGGVYTDTAKAMFADFPENTRPFYMRVA